MFDWVRAGECKPRPPLKTSLKINILFLFLLEAFLICLSITIKDKYVFSENIQAVEDYLKEHPDILLQARGESQRGSSKHSPLDTQWKDTITANDIAEWILTHIVYFPFNWFIN